jgi:hypothetical protein
MELERNLCSHISNNLDLISLGNCVIVASVGLINYGEVSLTACTYRGSFSPQKHSSLMDSIIFLWATQGAFRKFIDYQVCVDERVRLLLL